ncbi:hypothetical protein AAVH_43688 [Aphelenchoides avenae]|nr:hypothetical protein AAVH_43688 [Aphelenchus avenae]
MCTLLAITVGLQCRYQDFSRGADDADPIKLPCSTSSDFCYKIKSTAKDSSGNKVTGILR